MNSNQKPLVSNAADETQVKEAAKKEAHAIDQEKEDLRAILRSKEGRRFIWRQLKILDRTSVHSSGSMTYFNEGERNVALRLKAEVIKADVNAWLTMQLESSKGEISNG